MPTYEYRCKKCGKEYEVFHIGKEKKADIYCPACESKAHSRLMSVTAVSAKGSSMGSSSYGSPADSCESGGCCGGACSMN